MSKDLTRRPTESRRYSRPSPESPVPSRGCSRASLACRPHAGLHPYDHIRFPQQPSGHSLMTYDRRTKHGSAELSPQGHSREVVTLRLGFIIVPSDPFGPCLCSKHKAGHQETWLPAQAVPLSHLWPRASPLSLGLRLSSPQWENRWRRIGLRDF